MTGWAFTRSPDHRSLLLSHTGRVLVARAPGESVDLMTGTIDSTASFLPITNADFEALRELLVSRWLVQSEEEAGPVRGELLPGFALRLGSVPIDLRWNVPFDLTEYPHRVTVLRDGWRIDRLFRFRPIVFYTAYGDAGSVDELAISLQSLVGPGEYDADIAVLTDRSVDEIKALKPAGMRGTVVVIHSDAVDLTAWRAARLAVIGWRDGWTFQPVLYVDTDIIFDRPLGPMLEALAKAERIAAPSLPVGASAAVSAAHGADLVRDDAWDPDELQGFTTSVLGIPNLGRHGHVLELIGRILRNRASLFGRDVLPDGEQAVANYVSFRLARIDCELLTPYLKSVEEGLGEEDRRGMVHFGSLAPGSERLAEMRDYLLRIGGGAVGAVGDTVPPDDVAAYSMNPVLDFEAVMQSLHR